jgi:CheY-like chemotaxis protein
MRALLIVDDEFGITDALAPVLQDEGYVVATARNGQEALRAVAAHRPDLILLDVMMPVLDGPSTLRALRADAALADIPVVFMSALDEQVVNQIAAGFQGYLRKPFDLDRLLEMVSRFAPLGS